MPPSHTNRSIPVQTRLDTDWTYHPPLNSRSSTKVLGGEEIPDSIALPPHIFPIKKVLRKALTDTNRGG